MATMQAEAITPQVQPDERRRFNRVNVALLGRYMLANHQEYPCQTVDVSPGDASIIAPVRGAVGERVVIYLEHLGRNEGKITRHMAMGFAVRISAPTRKRDKIASQLTWLANRAELGLPEDRRHERIVPRMMGVVVKREGRSEEIQARLIDISMSGAALILENRIPIGTSVCLGRTPCKVVRHFQGGIAVEFLRALSPDKFDENIVL